MRKVLLITFLVALVALPAMSVRTKAHPIDVVYLEVFLDKDYEGREFEQNQAVINLRINWIQISTLFDEFDEKENFETQLRANTENVFDYLSRKIEFRNNGEKCNFSPYPINFNDNIVPEINGVPLSMDVRCSEPIDSVELDVALFIDSAPLQTNIVNFYRNPSELLKASQLNTTNTQMRIVTTKEEGQKTTKYYNLSSSSNSLLERIPKKLEEKSLTGILIVTLVSVLIGGLHALEGGHSKLILASLLINNKVDVKKGVLFVVIFTFTHLSDIFIVAIALLLANSVTDIYEQMTYLQVFSVYAMLFISLSLFLKELSNVGKKYFYNRKHTHKSHHHHTHHHDHVQDHTHSHGFLDLDGKQNFRSQMALAFLEGLAPCLTGWTVLMFIISSGILWLVFPVLLAFGVGVFAVLLIFMLLVNRFKNLVYQKVSFLSDYSPLISSALLLLTAIYFIV